MVTADSAAVSSSAVFLLLSSMVNLPQAFFDLENGNQELKSELKDLYINTAIQMDVVGNRKAVVIHLPYRLRNAFRKIHVRLVREREKKFSGKLKHAEELGKLTNLRKLGIRLCTDGIEDNKLEQSKEKLVSSLCKLDECGLLSLSINYGLEEKDGEEPFLPPHLGKKSRWLSSLPNLHTLSLMGPNRYGRPRCNARKRSHRVLDA